MTDTDQTRSCDKCLQPLKKSYFVGRRHKGKVGLYCQKQCMMFFSPTYKQYRLPQQWWLLKDE